MEDRSTEQETTSWVDFHEAHRIAGTLEPSPWPGVPLDEEVLLSIQQRTVEACQELSTRDDTGEDLASLDRAPNPQTCAVQVDYDRLANEKTKLLDWQEGKLVEFSLKNMPPYTAISHVWSENRFSIESRDSIWLATGMRQLEMHLRLRIQAPTLSYYRYLWIDTWCIDQNDPEDKLRQIPMMASIYQNAEEVLIVVSQDLGFWQGEWQNGLDKLEKALEIFRNPARRSRELKDCLSKNELGHVVIEMMRMVFNLANLPWNQRIWTAQEFVLASHVKWIGGDGIDLEVESEDVSAVVYMWDLVMNAGVRAIENYSVFAQVCSFVVINELRSKRRDQTEIMRLAELRKSSLTEDQIYGLMGASSVIVEAFQKNDGEVEKLWQRWWECAVAQGHVQWLNMPVLDFAPRPLGLRNCIMPSFHTRCKSARQTDFSRAKPHRLLSIELGTVTLQVRLVGICTQVEYAGDFKYTMTSSFDIANNMSISTKGTASRVCAALGSGRLCSSGLQSLVERVEGWLEAWFGALAPEGSRDYNGLISMTKRPLQTDDIHGQISHHALGKTYVGSMWNANSMTPILFVTNDIILNATENQYFVVDVMTYESSDSVDTLWRSLLVLEGYNPDTITTPFALHKIGTTYPVLIGDPGTDVAVAKEYNIHIAQMGLHTISIGGDACLWCQILRECIDGNLEHPNAPLEAQTMPHHSESEKVS